MGDGTPAVTTPVDGREAWTTYRMETTLDREAAIRTVRMQKPYPGREVRLAASDPMWKG